MGAFFSAVFLLLLGFGTFAGLLVGANPTKQTANAVQEQNLKPGSGVTFTTFSATGSPVVTTNPATNVTSSSARLNGTVYPHGLTTTVRFQYGRTTSYGSTTANQTKTGNTYQNVFANILGLSAGTTYHFRIVATNSAGTRPGSDRTFHTP